MGQVPTATGPTSPERQFNEEAAALTASIRNTATANTSNQDPGDLKTEAGTVNPIDVPPTAGDVTFNNDTND